MTCFCDKRLKVATIPISSEARDVLMVPSGWPHNTNDYPLFQMGMSIHDHEPILSPSHWMLPVQALPPALHLPMMQSQHQPAPMITVAPSSLPSSLSSMSIPSLPSHSSFVLSSSVPAASVPNAPLQMSMSVPVPVATSLAITTGVERDKVDASPSLQQLAQASSDANARAAAAKAALKLALAATTNNNASGTSSGTADNINASRSAIETDKRSQDERKKIMEMKKHEALRKRRERERIAAEKRTSALLILQEQEHEQERHCTTNDVTSRDQIDRERRIAAAERQRLEQHQTEHLHQHGAGATNDATNNNVFAPIHDDIYAAVAPIHSINNLPMSSTKSVISTTSSKSSSKVGSSSLSSIRLIPSNAHNNRALPVPNKIIPYPITKPSRNGREDDDDNSFRLESSGITQYGATNPNTSFTATNRPRSAPAKGVVTAPLSSSSSSLSSSPSVPAYLAKRGKERAPQSGDIGVTISATLDCNDKDNSHLQLTSNRPTSNVGPIPNVKSSRGISDDAEADLDDICTVCHQGDREHELLECADCYRYNTHVSLYLSPYHLISLSASFELMQRICVY
jgi:hypothetical protein